MRKTNGKETLMAIEYEVRILNVPINKMIDHIEKMGAHRVGSFHQKRFVYDYKPAQKGRWIRLRSNGEKTTLTLKEIKSLRIDGTSELEIVVSDFDATNQILNKLGYTPKAFQENFRIEYRLGENVFDFDIWPGIPAYLEIEGKSENNILNALEELEISENSVTTKDVESIYHDVYGIALDQIEHLHFSDAELETIRKYEI